MFQILKFLFFNVFLGLFDVLTDLHTCLFLWEEGHPAWALVTGWWMLTPFVASAIDFVVGLTTVLKTILTFVRIIEKWWKNEPADYKNFKEFVLRFYVEAVCHLPLVITLTL